MVNAAPEQMPAEMSNEQILKFQQVVDYFGNAHSYTAQFYMRIRDLRQEGQEPPVMKMGTYVNQQLSQHSDYFKALDSMMKCVEKNAGEKDPARQEQVCATEYKALRMLAFKQKLLYHDVNKRFIMHEWAYKNNNMSGN